MIARSFPQFGWLAPQAASVEQNSPGAIVPTASATPSLDQQQLNAMSLDLDAVQQRVDRVEASQEQMTREIAKLQAIEQYFHYKNLEPPSRPAPAPAPRAAARPPQAPAAR